MARHREARWRSRYDRRRTRRWSASRTWVVLRRRTGRCSRPQSTAVAAAAAGGAAAVERYQMMLQGHSRAAVGTVAVAAAACAVVQAYAAVPVAVERAAAAAVARLDLTWRAAGGEPG